MSFFIYWQELKHFWLSLAMWAATKCFGIVDIYALEDEILGLVWTNDKEFVEYVAQYQDEQALIERWMGTIPPIELRRASDKTYEELFGDIEEEDNETD